MPIAICNNCDKEVTWSNKRGRKLSDVVTKCCKTGAHSKPRKIELRSPRMDLPKVVALIQSARTTIYRDVMEWTGEPHNTVIYLKGEGVLSLANKWGDYKVGEVAHDDITDWRMARYFELIHSDVGYWHTVRIDEGDYQRLLGKAQDNGRKEVHSNVGTVAGNI